jgi:hypothetical protein
MLKRMLLDGSQVFGLYAPSLLPPGIAGGAAGSLLNQCCDAGLANRHVRGQVKRSVRLHMTRFPVQESLSRHVRPVNSQISTGLQVLLGVSLLVPLELQPGDIAFISGFVGRSCQDRKLRLWSGASLDH